MATWVDTSGVSDFVRSPQPEGGKIVYMSVEIEDNSDVRAFVETDLDNRTTAAVLAHTGTTPDIDKGSDGSPVFGFVESISNDGAVADCLVVGMTDDVSYAAATEDPDVGNSVQSKGTGAVKQTPTATDVAAGGQTDGRGIVLYKDTTNSYCRLWFP